jgi:hypothetical protein
MKYDSAKIAEAIKKAVDAAQVHAESDDGGTCNFDCAFLTVPQMREEQAKQIAELAGVRLYLWPNHSIYGRILQVQGGRSGMGNRQTRMAEEMKRSLEADGFKAGVYYQMD